MMDNGDSRARELKAIDRINPFEERGKMTDKQPNQFVLIDQVMNELKNVMQNIETLKASTRDTPRTSANPPSAPAATTGVNPGGSESGLRRRR